MLVYRILKFIITHAYREQINLQIVLVAPQIQCAALQVTLGQKLQLLTLVGGLNSLKSEDPDIV